MKKLSAAMALFLLFTFAGPLALASGEGVTSPGQNQTVLYLDSQNRYDKMSKPYAQGYVPTVSGGYAYLTVPLLCDGELQNHTLSAGVQLGDPANSPFIYKNYQKQVSLTGGVYLILFSLELSPARVNGNYPVIVTAGGTDWNGNPVQYETTVYVSITDGKAAEEPKEEDVILQPKILVESCRISADGKEDAGTVRAGEAFTLTAVLVNKSKTEDAVNMTVTVAPPNENFVLTSVSDTQFAECIRAGKTKEIIFAFQAGAAAEPGQYDFLLTYDFAYGKGLTGSGTGKAKLTVSQELNMQFDPLQLPESITVADTVAVPMQAMNLSRIKAYHVRATLKADGLLPSGTVFFGDIEPGGSVTAEMQITASGLREGDSLYGKTGGTVTYTYEDAQGNVFQWEDTVSTSVCSPLTKQAEPEDQPGQWWILLAVLTGLILAVGMILLIRYFKGRKQS